ncbi:MAG: PTS fructose transporter subunit IIA [Lachnospiraceae bacterium]|nr:PTS fructose transporter subunit IIA [Lachnospiraceae bacterium]MBD5455246.1 PTS fructose transporter subunit IIA [Lachnospiraceae bacterium]
MKYVVLVSHGRFAPGLHSALDMLAGEGREDILSASLENGMSSEVYADNLRKCLEVVTPEDEILLLGDLVGGSPLTTATNVIAEKDLLKKTAIIGGMSLPLALSAVLMKDGMELRELVDMLIPEAREELKEFQVTSEESEDEI